MEPESTSNQVNAGSCQENELDAFIRELTYLHRDRLRAPTTVSPARVVLADLITPEVRSRKPGIEFPMSLEALEHALLRYPNVRVDYAFLPTSATRAQMHAEEERLLTLGVHGQPRLPVKDADILGINMMNYSQAPEFFMLLHLAGIPFFRNERSVSDPIVVVGGNVWPNPLPLSDFIDVMAVGDGERTLYKVLTRLEAYPGLRKRVLKAVSQTPGAYVPGEAQGPVQPEQIDFARSHYPAGSAYLRRGVGAVVLSRGCPHRCAFCNNAAVGGRYRVKPYAQITAYVDALKSAGARKITLIAASASFYASEGRTLGDIIKGIRERGMTVRSMSDRPEAFHASFLRDFVKEKGKIQIAPEASPRIRAQVLGKHLGEEAIERSLVEILRAGINHVQLYAILAVPRISPGLVSHLACGFEGEQPADIAYLAKLAMHVVHKMRAAGLPPPETGAYVTLDCMPMIPAIGTPLQSVSFSTYRSYRQSIQMLESSIRPEYREHVRVSVGMDPCSHLLQMLMERNGPAAGRVVLRAFVRSGHDLPDLRALEDAMEEFGMQKESLHVEIPVEELCYHGLVTPHPSRRTQHGTRSRSTRP
jgi:radical SAM superfamily enzyme YgiQ (UPF0313 family)